MTEWHHIGRGERIEMANAEREAEMATQARDTATDLGSADREKIGVMLVALLRQSGGGATLTAEQLAPLPAGMKIRTEPRVDGALRVWIETLEEPQP